MLYHIRMRTSINVLILAIVISLSRTVAYPNLRPPIIKKQQVLSLDHSRENSELIEDYYDTYFSGRSESNLEGYA